MQLRQKYPFLVRDANDPHCRLHFFLHLMILITNTVWRDRKLKTLKAYSKKNFRRHYGRMTVEVTTLENHLYLK